jgi:large-conductance mechanosensitive channel
MEEIKSLKKSTMKVNFIDLVIVSIIGSALLKIITTIVSDVL